jgi:hypothetical protein
MRTAANRIERWPTVLSTAQDLVEIPGIKARMAALVVTEGMRRKLQPDEVDFLEGAAAKYPTAETPPSPCGGGRQPGS